MYHFVCPSKYRRIVFNDTVDKILQTVCQEIEHRYEITFLEIGSDKDHVHFLVQSVPEYSPKKIIQTIKSITAREVFRLNPEVKKQLWGGEFWSKGYFCNTIGQNANEVTITNYIKKQGKELEYTKIYQPLLL
jgi:putative transposase